VHARFSDLIGDSEGRISLHPAASRVMLRRTRTVRPRRVNAADDIRYAKMRWRVIAE